MKNYILVALLLQSVTALHGMQRVKKALQTTRSALSSVRLKISERSKILKSDIAKLQNAIECIHTNSCGSEQQAYIKSLVKKLAVGVAAAMAVCGIYSVAKSKQFESLKEDVASGRNIALGFRVTDPINIVFLEDVKLFLDALRTDGKEIATRRYDLISLQIGTIHDQRTLEAAQNMLERYGDSRENMVDTLKTVLKAALFGLGQKQKKEQGRASGEIEISKPVLVRSSG